MVELDNPTCRIPNNQIQQNDDAFQIKTLDSCPFHDDGSVESHATGTTKYGNDYQIDSYMDSNGNIHGSVNIDGKTYNV